jgi:hypothetical protein
MQVQSVGSAQNFQAYGRRRENIDAFLSLSDRDLQNLALLKTNATINEKKHKNVNRAIWASVPVVAGIGSAILDKGSNYTRLANGLKSTAKWAGTFAIIDLALGGMNAIKKDSNSLSNFDKKHPFLSFLAMLGGSIFAVDLAGRGLGKLSANLKPATRTKIETKLKNIEQKVDANAFLNNIRKIASDVIAKTPKALKSVGKFALGWAPMIMMLGALSHQIDYSAKRNSTFVKNYTDLKERQDMLATARANELARELKEWD